MKKRDLIQANASLENLRQNLDMKDFAKEILLEENYNCLLYTSPSPRDA